jgi:hypothetical protein
LNDYPNEKCISEEKMTKLDLGDMFMYQNEILITRSSMQILFFRKMQDKSTGNKVWQQYHSFQSKGLVSGNQSVGTFQVIEDQYINFYEFCEETWIPKLQNVMMNFMQCGMILFVESQKFCITYKQNQNNFTSYKRKVNHDFKVRVNDGNFCGAVGSNIENEEVFIVHHNGQLILFDDADYSERARVDLYLNTYNKKSIQILSTIMSKDNKYLSVCVGEKLIKDEVRVVGIIILTRLRVKDSLGNFILSF